MIHNPSSEQSGTLGPGIVKDLCSSFLFYWISNDNHPLFFNYYCQNYEYFVEDEEAKIREMEVMDRLLEVIALDRYSML